MDRLRDEVRLESLWMMMSADDTGICNESRVENKFHGCRDGGYADSGCDRGGYLVCGRVTPDNKAPGLPNFILVNHPWTGLHVA